MADAADRDAADRTVDHSMKAEAIRVERTEKLGDDMVTWVMTWVVTWVVTWVWDGWMVLVIRNCFFSRASLWLFKTQENRR